MKTEIQKALFVLNSGGNLLCPTDTVWGLSADATNFEAVKKVFELKKRPKNKSMIILVSSLEMLENYVREVPNFIQELLKSVVQPTSIIYPKSKNLANNVVAKNGSIAVRVVGDGFCHDLIAQFKRPIISTSANFSGEESPSVFSEISEELKSKVDYCIQSNEGKKEPATPSNIYLIDGKDLKKIR